MALATIGFALAPALGGCCRSPLIFGIGFGGVLSSGWALAMDAIPKLRDVARDLGLWGIATSRAQHRGAVGRRMADRTLSAERAPVIKRSSGYRALVLRSHRWSVLRVGRRPLSSLWAWPLRIGRRYVELRLGSFAYRVRVGAEFRAAADRR